MSAVGLAICQPRENIFSFRNVWVHFSKEEMGRRKVLKSRLFILEVTDKFPFLTISTFNLNTHTPADWKQSARRSVTNKGGKRE